jgi:hypothetical protein
MGRGLLCPAVPRRMSVPSLCLAPPAPAPPSRAVAELTITLEPALPPFFGGAGRGGMQFAANPLHATLRPRARNTGGGRSWFSSRP